MTKIQGLVFFGIIAGGTTLSIVSLNKWGKRVEVEEPPPAVSTPDGPGSGGGQAMSPADTPPEGKTNPAPGSGKPEPPAPPSGAANPQMLTKNVASLLEKGDLGAILEMAGEGAVSPAVKKQLEMLVEEKGLKVDPDNPVTELAKTADGARWVIHLKNAATGEKADLYVDVAKAPGGKGWEIQKLALPAEMAAGGAMQAGDADALSIAHEFAKAIMNRDFERARKLTNPDKITDERIAALMIAIEDGEFHLRGSKPLVMTLERDDLAWVLTRVDSANGSSEFAIEMNPGGENGWEIHGVTFSKVIATIANAAGAGDVAYTPIVADPKGGDSLVLYFEFDDDVLNNRSRKQLAIVADILRQDPKRRIHINGHADALGTDQYNKGLSDNRAASVSTALIEMGVANDQVVTEAFGEAMPRRPNFNPDGTDNPSGRSQNRRAEVYLDF